MTRDEWLSIGYEKGIIEDIPDCGTASFFTVYKQWFKMKMHKIKPESLDRIEVTFNKYYQGSDLLLEPVHKIDKHYVCRFLNEIILNHNLNRKEFGRIYQIVNNVMVYALDMSIGYAQVIDWGFVKRFVYSSDLVRDDRKEYMISDTDRTLLFNAVLLDDIYPLKRSACLCLLLNFYLGLRIGELASLMFSDFDVKNRGLRIFKSEVKYYPRDDDGCRAGTIIYSVVDDVKTKTSFRILPLTEECIEIYNLIVEHHKVMGYESPYLCYDGTETIATRSLERTLTRLCKLVGISHVNSHRIRKTYASCLHMAGVPTRVITDLCGHSDMETTECCYLLNYEGGYSPYMNVINSALNFINGGLKND